MDHKLISSTSGAASELTRLQLISHANSRKEDPFKISPDHSYFSNPAPYPRLAGSP